MSEGELRVAKLYDKFGKQAILFALAPGTKEPLKGSRWRHMTLEESLGAQNQSELMNMHNGVAIRLDNIVDIDTDNEEDYEAFMKEFPLAAATRITKGKNGGHFWFFCQDAPEKKIYFSKREGKKKSEYRKGNKYYTVLEAIHPETGKPYEVVADNIVVEAAWVDQLEAVLNKFKSDPDGDSDEPKTKLEFPAGWAKKHKDWELTEYPLGKLMRYFDLLIGKSSDGKAHKWNVKCPWKGEHTGGGKTDGAGDAVIWTRPELFPRFKCFHAHCAGRDLVEVLDWAEAREEGVVQKISSRLALPPIIHAEFQENRPEEPDQVILGVLHEGMKMTIAGPPKTYKSWTAMDLGLAVATGGKWLGHFVKRGRVLFLNMEMPPWAFDIRRYEIQQAKGIKQGAIEHGYFDVLNLRGNACLDVDWNPLIHHLKGEGPYGLIIVDPIYKLLGARDENKAGDVAGLLREVDKIGIASQAAVLIVHHFAKGDPTEKAVGDRASGSGVWYRDPDVFMTITPDKTLNNVAKVDIRARMVPWLEPMLVEWDFPQWKPFDTASKSKFITKMPRLTNEMPPENSAVFKWIMVSLGVPFGEVDKVFTKARKEKKVIYDDTTKEWRGSEIA